jgi:hypothetical protein
VALEAGPCGCTRAVCVWRLRSGSRRRSVHSLCSNAVLAANDGVLWRRGGGRAVGGVAGTAGQPGCTTTWRQHTGHHGRHRAFDQLAWHSCGVPTSTSAAAQITRGRKKGGAAIVTATAYGKQGDTPTRPTEGIGVDPGNTPASTHNLLALARKLSTQRLRTLYALSNPQPGCEVGEQA